MKYYDLGDKVVTSIPKCGTKSIAKALGNKAEIHADRAVGRRVITFFRHPISRLVSAYRYFNYTEGWQQDMPLYDRRFNRKASYEEFVDSVLSGDRNRHWDSQSSQLMYLGGFVPTEVYRFEDINEIWPKVIGIPLDRINSSKYVEVNEDYRRSELDNFYTEDLERWNSAKQNSDTQTK